MGPKLSQLAHGAVLAAVLGLTSACFSQTSLPGWSLAWEDEFDSFDASRWTKVDTNVPTNNSQQDYLPEQVSVSGGNLVILAEDEPSRGLPFRSGQVISKSEQRLGRWEVRAKLPTSRGMWPAIWLLPQVDTYLWPSGGEIDIMENRGDQPNLTSSAFHYGSRTPYVHQFVYSEQQTAVGNGLANYHTEFHTYAVDWTDDYLRFYVDGVHHYTVHDEDVGGFLSQNTAPMQLVINNAIGGDFLDNPDGSTQWPQTMEIDWVRVYEADPDTFVATLDNGGFEDGDGVLAGWTVFGNDLHNNPNVRVASDAVLEGDSSLKLFGPFQGGTTYSGVSQGISVEPGRQVTASASALVRSADSIAGTDNLAVLKIEFYSEFGGKYGSDTMIDETSLLIASGGTTEDEWARHNLTTVVPAGAVEARLAIVFTQPGSAAGAVHVDDIDFAVANPTAAMGDYNGDGLVDAADYTVWRDSLGEVGVALPADGDGDGMITTNDFDYWRQRVGSSASLPLRAPEPSAGMITVAALAGIFSPRTAAAPALIANQPDK